MLLLTDFRTAGSTIPTFLLINCIRSFCIGWNPDISTHKTLYFPLESLFSDRAARLAVKKAQGRIVRIRKPVTTRGKRGNWNRILWSILHSLTSTHIETHSLPSILVTPLTFKQLSCEVKINHFRVHGLPKLKVSAACTAFYKRQKFRSEQ